MMKHAHHGSTKALYDICKSDQYDILVMGSSKAHHGIIPTVLTDSLSMTCYNAGQDGNGIILAYGMLQLIDDERLPKLIIYDFKQQFDLYKIAEDGDYSRYVDFLKYFYTNASVKALIKRVAEGEIFKLNSSFYRYNGSLVSVLSGFLRNTPSDPNLGYSPRRGVLEDSSEEIKDYSETQIDTLKFSVFKDFIRLTKERGIKLIITISPEFNAPYSEDFRPMKEVCEKEGIIVLDYFENPQFQNKVLFFDHCHFNTAGAEFFSSKIASDILRFFKCNIR